MGRKVKYSKEVKVKACEDYEKGDVSFNDIGGMRSKVFVPLFCFAISQNQNLMTKMKYSIYLYVLKYLYYDIIKIDIEK